MGKQVGLIKLTGTFGNLCLYRADGQYYARQVHRHNSKKVKTSPRFALTMIHARILGRASKIASKVYRDLPRDFRQFWMYRAFTGEAMQMLKRNKSDEETLKILWHTYASVHHMPVEQQINTRPTKIKIKKSITPVEKFKSSRRGLWNKYKSDNYGFNTPLSAAAGNCYIFSNKPYYPGEFEEFIFTRHCRNDTTSILLWHRYRKKSREPACY